MNALVEDRPMQPIARLAEISSLPRVIFTDVDDTLTYNGMLPVETYAALHQLKAQGYTVIPVTGGSAGWCDCMIKTWPIEHVIGENGAITMSKDDNGIVSTHYVRDAAAVKADMIRLVELGEELGRRYPEIGFTQDQKFRLTDVAFDIGQTVTVDDNIAESATQWLLSQGVQARQSSIHINVWVGEHSKATGAKAWLDARNVGLNQCLFIGDSPNDDSMFTLFPVSVGVANIHRFVSKLECPPVYVTQREGGHGFVEMAEVLLAAGAD